MLVSVDASVSVAAMEGFSATMRTFDVAQVMGMMQYHAMQT